MESVEIRIVTGVILAFCVSIVTAAVAVVIRACRATVVQNSRVAPRVEETVPSAPSAPSAPELVNCVCGTTTTVSELQWFLQLA